MFYIYTNKISSYLDVEELVQYIPNEKLSTVENASYILFPIFLEVILDYSAEEYKASRLQPNDIDIIKQAYTDACLLAETLEKKLLVFFYRDPTENYFLKDYMLLFRTSLYKSAKKSNELSLPAFIPDKELCINEYFSETKKSNYFHRKSAKPQIAFAGQSAPLQLDYKTKLRLLGQRLAKLLHVHEPAVYYNRGYLARRNASKSLLRDKQIVTDIKFTVWQDEQINPVSYKQAYYSQLIDFPYQLCASGFGNYSFRFYEILLSGRIPVLINTDCQLPFEHIIDWKKHIVLIEEADAGKANQLLKDFHSSIHPDDFTKMQMDNQDLYKNFLTKRGFFTNLELAISGFK